MKAMQRSLFLGLTIVASASMSAAQAPAQPPAQTPVQPTAANRAPAPRNVLSVSTSAFPDGGEIPMKYCFRGENKSPAFEFHWNQGTSPGAPPDNLQSYAVVFHDIENSTNRGTADTLHWSAFNIPGAAKGMPEGLGPGELPDGTKNGPGIRQRGGNPGAYFGPGAGPGPFHHYVFEFYALDNKLDLPANTTREDLMKAMEGHVVGKAAYVGRFHGQPQ